LAGVFLALIEVFLDQGFSAAIVQRHDLEPEHLDTAFWTNLLIGIFITLFGIAAADIAANLFKQPELTSIIRWLSLSFLIRSFSAVQDAIFQRNLAFKTLAIRSISAEIAGSLVGITMAFTGFGVWSLVSRQLVSDFVQVLVLWWASYWRPKFNFSKKHFQNLFSFGINIVGINLLIFFNRRSDDFLIGYFLGPTSLGYYSIAYRLLTVMTQLLSYASGSSVAMPLFSKLQREPERLRETFYTVTQFSSLIAFPAFLSVTLLAPELVTVLFGTQWTPSIPVMQILSFVGIVNSVGGFGGSIIQACGKPSWNLMLGLINTPANLIAFSIAVHWGIVAVALAFTIRGYLFIPFPLFCVRKLINIKLTTYFRQYTTPLVGSITMSATILGIKYFLGNLPNTPFLLFICVLFGILMYIMTIWLIAPNLIQKVREIIYLSGMIPTKKSN
jgi:PST family polysaccharide transporter